MIDQYDGYEAANDWRYIIFTGSKINSILGKDEYANLVVWSGIYDAAVSYVVPTTNSIYDGCLALNRVWIEVGTSKTISKFVKNKSRGQFRAFKDFGT